MCSPLTVGSRWCLASYEHLMTVFWSFTCDACHRTWRGLFEPSRWLLLALKTFFWSFTCDAGSDQNSEVIFSISYSCRTSTNSGSLKVLKILTVFVLVFVIFILLFALWCFHCYCWLYSFDSGFVKVRFFPFLKGTTKQPLCTIWLLSNALF